MFILYTECDGAADVILLKADETLSFHYRKFDPSWLINFASKTVRHLFPAIQVS